MKFIFFRAKSGRRDTKASDYFIAVADNELEFNKKKEFFALLHIGNAGMDGKVKYREEIKFFICFRVKVCEGIIFNVNVE